jgi:hypothetical protein
MSDEAVLRIAVPSFDAMLRECARRGAVPRLPACEWLMARGESRPVGERTWRDWLLDGSGLGVDVLERFPAGPCSAALAGDAPGARNWARAEPVHLLAALDHLQLGAPVPLALAAGESDRLCADLNAHLADSGFRLQPTAHGWLCACPDDVEWAAADPALALGRDLRELLPAGRDATRIRAMVNEMQMLLHDHPVNSHREAQGLPVVNSVWLWGAGRAGEKYVGASGALATDDAWLAGLWRLHDGELRAVQQSAAAMREERGDLRIGVATGSVRDEPSDWLAAIERDVLEPARAALLGRRFRHVALHTGAAVLDVPAGARLRFWRRSRPLGEVLR